MRDNTFQHRASQTRYIWLYDYKYAARRSSCPPLRSCLDFAQGNRDCRMCGRNLNCASGAGTMIVKSPLNVRAGIAPAGWHGADMQQFAILGALRFQARPFRALRPSGPSARGRNLSRPCRKRPRMPEGGLDCKLLLPAAQHNGPTCPKAAFPLLPHNPRAGMIARRIAPQRTQHPQLQPPRRENRASAPPPPSQAKSRARTAASLVSFTKRKNCDRIILMFQRRNAYDMSTVRRYGRQNTIH